jgi:hypothetical protein
MDIHRQNSRSDGPFDGLTGTGEFIHGGVDLSYPGEVGNYYRIAETGAKLSVRMERFRQAIF